MPNNAYDVPSNDYVKLDVFYRTLRVFQWKIFNDPAVRLKLSENSYFHRVCVLANA